MIASLKLEIDDVEYMKVQGEAELATDSNCDAWDAIESQLEKLFGSGKVKLIREYIEIE